MILIHVNRQSVVTRQVKLNFSNKRNTPFWPYSDKAMCVCTDANQFIGRLLMFITLLKHHTIVRHAKIQIISHTSHMGQSGRNG